ncbi:LAME_0F15060g1_1 [Lachancea meyersii CBS 8951]|uniref:WD repeat-containing protein JIP5 n=1 Tax=Lachancea meyersii CBS 8951 TaxID=1266667 RepID=A0A1G4JY90_9SACH|nr:LAME_0F15060g1_1 [Lachancea meyersii CBS 8951]
MSKKKVKSSQDLSSVASASSPILEITFPEPLFALCCHPEQPLIFSGQASGHVMCHRYDAKVLQERMKRNEEDAAQTKAKTEEQNTNKKFWVVAEAKEDGSSDSAGFKLQWKTKRHKGSVRAMCLDADGSHLYTIGVDCVLKKANSETGKVVKKRQVTQDTSVKITKLVKSTTHRFLLLGDENGNVFVLNSDTLELQTTIKKIHSGDAINDIFQFTGQSVYKFISVGQTTLAYWDSRESNESDFKIPDDDQDAKRKVRLSDDQEDEILCGTFVDPQGGDTLVCGMGEGLLTVWKPKKNDLVDQISRIKVKKNESLDCVVATLQDDDSVWTGCSDGQVYKVNVKTGKVTEIRRHSGLDEVVFLDLDCEYRLISGGMDKIKLWELADDEPASELEVSASDEEDSANESDSEPSSHSDSIDGSASDSGSDSDSGSNVEDSGSGEEEEELVGLSKEELLKELEKDLVESSDEEQSTSSKKRNAKGSDDSKKASKKQKTKQKPLTSKQLRNLQKHEHGIKRFAGL